MLWSLRITTSGNISPPTIDIIPAERVLIHVANRYHVKSAGPAMILMMIGTVKTVKTLQKYQIPTADNPLCCLGQPSHCWRLVKWLVRKSRGFPRLFVSIQTEIYLVKMFSLRGLTVKMIWSDKHEIVGESLPALYFIPDFFY